MSDRSSPGYHASDGAAYERFLGRWTERLAVLFADFARLPSEGEVLDLGCGTGSLAAEIARRRPGCLVLGADVAEAYVDFARKRHLEANLRFEVCDASDLPFASARFAASLAQLVLTFVPDPKRVVAEMVRVTRPEGVVAAAVWDFCGGLVYQRLFWDTAAGIDPAAKRARDRLFAHPLSEPRWAGIAVDLGRSGRRRSRLPDHAHGFCKLRRLLGPAPGRAGPGRHLCYGTGRSPARPAACSGEGRLSLWAPRRSPFAHGDGVGREGPRQLRCLAPSSPARRPNVAH
jgi:SAM-dependent methyltransferase